MAQRLILLTELCTRFADAVSGSGQIEGGQGRYARSGLAQRVPECTEGKQVRMGRDFGFSDLEVERCALSWLTGCPKLQISPKEVESEVVRVIQLRFRVGARTFDRESPAIAMEGPEAMPKGIWASEMKGPA